MMPKGTPEVSICLPVYNGGKFLAEALESALQQSFSDFELLAVDDCSTDDSPQILEEFARRDSRITVWRNDKNKGLFQNYNEAIKRAQGQLIKPFAQDDLWEKNTLERMVGAYHGHDGVTLIAVARNWISETGDLIETRRHLEETCRVDGTELIKQCLMEFKNSIGEPSAVLFPRQAGSDGFDARYYHLGDLDYWLRILQHGDYVFLNEPLCRFRRHQGSATNKNLENLLFGIDMLRLGDVFQNVLDEMNLTAHEYKLLAVRRIASFANKALSEGDMSLSRFLEQLPQQPEEIKRQLSEFRELALYALVYADTSVTELEAELFVVNATLADLHKTYSKSGLVRNAAKFLRVALPGRHPN
jgi:glycosyltransferase involved in cell wall biosynthesis